MDKGYLVVNNLITELEAAAIVSLMDTVLTSRDLTKALKNYSRHVADWTLIGSSMYTQINDKLKELMPKTLQWRGQQFALYGLAKAVEMVHFDFLTGGALTKNFYTINLYLNTTDGGNLKDNKTIVTQPISGRCAIIDMHTWHSSSKVNTGSKYLLKSHIAYSLCHCQN